MLVDQERDRLDDSPFTLCVTPEGKRRAAFVLEDWMEASHERAMSALDVVLEAIASAAEPD